MSTRDWLLEAAYASAQVVDHMQTLDIARHPGLYETNPLLGRHPSDHAIYIHGAAVIVGHALTTYMLPEKYRLYWQASSLALELYVVNHNYELGLLIGF